MGISYFEGLGPNSVLNYVRARTPRGLRLAMLRNNMKLKAHIEYKPPYRDRDGYLYAWFYEPMQMTEVIDGN